MMKFSKFAACLTAGICLAGAGLASAADEVGAPAKSGSEAARPLRHDPVAAAQKRLESLHKKLHLNAAQQDAWQSYSAALLKLAQAHVQEREVRRAAFHKGGEDMSTPERLEQMAERMRRGAESIGKLAGDTKIFYAQLTPEQKTIFDLYAKSAWRGRMFQGMHTGFQAGGKR